MTAAEANYYRWLRERTTDEIIRQAREVGVVTFHGVPVPAGIPVTGYPPGYRDPAWDGTEEGFRAVAEARADALVSTMNGIGVAPDGMEYAWDEQAGPGPSLRRVDVTRERPGGPVTLAAAAHAGDSHIWVTVPLPETAGQVTIGGLNRETHRFDHETHLIDQGMIRSQDGPTRNAVWLQTALLRTWPTGTKVTAG